MKPNHSVVWVSQTCINGLQVLAVRGFIPSETDTRFSVFFFFSKILIPVYEIYVGQMNRFSLRGITNLIREIILF